MKGLPTPLKRRLGFKVSDVASFIGRDPTTLIMLIARLMERLGRIKKSRK
jgi:hypothetical protein